MKVFVLVYNDCFTFAHSCSRITFFNSLISGLPCIGLRIVLQTQGEIKYLNDL